MRTILRDNYEPVMGAYHEVLLIDEAQSKRWLFDCDGVFTELPAPSCIENEKGDSETCAISQKAFTDEVDKLDLALTSETAERKAEDKAIWDEIEEIEMSSDVVDIVGTYADLQAYDTSHLNNNDIIKVISDETHDDATSYYRYTKSTDTFSYVGSEGPYYTESEVDTLLGGKQDTLTAGTNITITNNTISATDTTYTHFTGATASTDGVAGLVPAPVAGDEDKVLKGDGTWGTISSAANTIFYMNASESGGTRHIYKNPDMTGAATSQEVFDANDQGQVILRISTSATPDMYSDCYLQNAYKATGDYQLLFLDEKTYRSFDTTTLSADTFTYSARVLQDKLTAGTNITISGNTISASYSSFGGATSSTAGSTGLVPAPAAGDEGKVLKGDGTWGSVSAGLTTFYAPKPAYIGASINLYKDSTRTTAATYQDVVNAIQSGEGIDIVIMGDGSTYDSHNVACAYYYDDISAAPDYYISITFPNSGTYFNSMLSNYFNNLSGTAKLYWNDQRYNLPTAAANLLGGVKVGSNLTISSGVLSANTLSGTDGVNDGTAGYAPAPLAADAGKYLKSDGTWAALPGANNISTNDWNALWQ